MVAIGTTDGFETLEESFSGCRCDMLADSAKPVQSWLKLDWVGAHFRTVENQQFFTDLDGKFQRTLVSLTML